jgi:hypothetical protein
MVMVMVVVVVVVKTQDSKAFADAGPLQFIDHNNADEHRGGGARVLQHTRQLGAAVCRSTGSATHATAIFGLGLM